MRLLVPCASWSLLIILCRFRWVFCQLDTLRRCMPSSIRRALNELPISLDDMYERMLQGIPKEKFEHASRLFQCMVAAVRPLRVEELAELLRSSLAQTIHLISLTAGGREIQKRQSSPHVPPLSPSSMTRPTATATMTRARKLYNFPTSLSENS